MIRLLRKTFGFSGARAEEIFTERYDALARKTDYVFAVLFLFQWLLGIVLAFVMSPKTWSGANSATHIHVYAAIFLGGTIAALPIFLIWRNPGATVNRMVAAVSQILFSVLLIHLTGGRIETHFHIFGSLAFLAFYRDWRPVAIATVVTLIDHLLRGALWPESVYGVLASTPWRAIEHAAWVVFEDVILIFSISIARDELASLAESQAHLEQNMSHIEELVKERTMELSASNQKIVDQQQVLIAASKMSALGEMAAGVAHEINNPLAIIQMRAEQLDESMNDDPIDRTEAKRMLATIHKTTDRIAKIVSGLRFFARDGRKAPAEKHSLSAIFDDTLSFCNERFKQHGVEIQVIKSEGFADLQMECRSVEISQVILNLLNNSFDAVEHLDEKWIKLEAQDKGEYIAINVTDSGQGIVAEIRDKMMDPFYTTKEIGKGTGLGLSISKGVVEAHGGKLLVDTECKNTKLTILIPKVSRDESTDKGKVAA